MSRRPGVAPALSAVAGPLRQRWLPSAQADRVVEVGDHRGGSGPLAAGLVLDDLERVLAAG